MRAREEAEGSCDPHAGQKTQVHLRTSPGAIVQEFRVIWGQEELCILKGLGTSLNSLLTKVRDVLGVKGRERAV